MRWGSIAGTAQGRDKGGQLKGRRHEVGGGTREGVARGRAAQTGGGSMITGQCHRGQDQGTQHRYNKATSLWGTNGCVQIKAQQQWGSMGAAVKAQPQWGTMGGLTSRHHHSGVPSRHSHSGAPW